MKKNAFLVLLLSVLTVVGLSYSNTQETSASFSLGGDNPGDGFESGDPCGYVMGTSTEYNNIDIDADSVSNNDQACADESGYFYEYDAPLLIGTDRDSQVIVSIHTAITTSFTIDLGGSNSSYSVVVDQSTGRWSGYGYITDASYSGSNRWVWFDWTCVGSDSFSGSDTTCGGGINSQSYRVQTDLDTGVISGYAWNDDMGFLSFRNLTMELAPREIQLLMTVETYDGVSADATDLDTAVLADGVDHYAVTAKFWDVSAGSFLDETDFVSGYTTMSLTTIGDMVLDLVEEDGGDPVRLTGYSPEEGCNDGSGTYEFCFRPGIDNNSDGDYDDAGDRPWAIVTFISSGAPTTDMLGLNTDSDLAIDYPTYHPGCRWIYHDQWYEVDGSAVQTACPSTSSTHFEKEDVFYDRQTHRNMIGIDWIGLTLGFTSNREVSVTSPDGSFVHIGDYAGGYSAYTYTPDYNGDLDEDGTEDGYFLSYKPRFTANKFVAVYDDEEYTRFPSDEAEPMKLSVSAQLRETSYLAQAQAFAAKPMMKIYYQLDALSSSAPGPYAVGYTPPPPSPDDKFLLIDTADTGTAVDCGRRTDTLAENTYGDSYIVEGATAYNMGYGKKSTSCSGGAAPTAAASTNTLSNPTAEQWVCDYATLQLLGGPSCYWTAYMDILSAYDDPLPMKVFGPISSVSYDEALFTDQDEFTVGGSSETIKLRNDLYSRVVGYMRGKTAGPGVIQANMVPSGDLEVLMDGDLVVGWGDVTVEASSVDEEMTLVVFDGNVFFNGDITRGRMGVIVFNGNACVRSNVVHLNVNYFGDGGVYSSDAATCSQETAWANDEERVTTLASQLYWSGSLVARVLSNNSVDENGDGLLERGDGSMVDADTMYTMPDGSTMSGYEIAREHDLNMLRQVRLCFPLDGSGIPDFDAEPGLCAGQILSEYGQENGIYNSLILDYAAPDSLAIFW